MDEREIPPETAITVSAEGCDADIVPVRMASFDRWYKRDVEADPEVVRAVTDEILRLSHRAA